MKRAVQPRRTTNGASARATGPRRATPAGSKTSPDSPVAAPAGRDKAGREKVACEFTGSAADFLPPKLELPLLREAAKGCRGCGLYCNATQTIFGEGPPHAAVM